MITALVFGLSALALAAVGVRLGTDSRDTSYSVGSLMRPPHTWL